MSLRARSRSARIARRTSCPAGLAAAATLVLGLTGCTVTINTPSPTTSPSSPRAATTGPEQQAPTGRDWPDVVEAVRSGVVSIESSTCLDARSGSGFLVAEDLVATAAHVVDGAQTVSVRTTGGDIEAEVVGFDRLGDLALVLLDSPVPGHVFDFAATSPRHGDQVLGLGYPLDSPSLVVTEGRISGIDLPVSTDTMLRDDMLQTDAGLNPGSSGGPLISKSGAVVGIVSAGLDDANVTSWAIPGAAFAQRFAAWKSRTAPIDVDGCTPGTTTSADLVLIATDDPEAAEVAALLDIHGRAINAGDVEAAFADFTPSLQEYVGDPASWGEQLGSVEWLGARITRVETGGDGILYAEVDLIRVGDPSVDGECFVWTKEYEIVESPTDRPLKIAWVEDLGEPVPCDG